MCSCKDDRLLMLKDNFARSLLKQCCCVRRMIGTDIRLMTPIMNQVILNPTLIAINQDHLAPASTLTWIMTAMLCTG